jgi:hypothetical protein
LFCQQTFRNATLDSQTLASFCAPRIDHGTSATSFHANQKAMSTCATDFRGLVRAFHFEILGIPFGTVSSGRPLKWAGLHKINPDLFQGSL